MDHKNYYDRHPQIGARVTPELKAELLKLQKENGGTLSDTIEDVLQSGLNNHLNSNSPSKNDVKTDSEILSQFNDQLDKAKDTAYTKGLSEGYRKCAIETKKKINGKLNGLKKVKDLEKDYECPGCGVEFDGKPEICPGCGEELDWDDMHDRGSDQDKKGILEPMMDSINDVFDSITGNEPTSSEPESSKNDNKKTIQFVGGNKVVPESKQEEKDWECEGCGVEFDGKPKSCPGCGREFDWDDDDDSGGGLLDGIKKWNNEG